MVYLRRGKGNDELIQQFEYKYLFPEDLEFMRKFIESKEMPIEKIQQDLKRHDKSSGFTFTGLQIAKLIWNTRS